MNTRRTAARRMEEDLGNAEVPSPENQVHPQGYQVPLQDHALVISPPMTHENIRLKFLTLSQPMTNKAPAVSTQAQAMAAEANTEVGPRT